MAPAAMAMFDADIRYLAASARWRDTYRLAGDVIGKSHYELFPDTPERWRQVHRRAMAGETLRAEKDAFTGPSGAVQWVRWEVRPWRHAHGGIGGVIIFSEDITDSILAHEALGQSEARLRIALAAAGAGVWERDLRTNRNIWSDELWKLYGLAQDVEPSYETWRQSIHADDRDSVSRTVNDAVAMGAELRVEWRAIAADGVERWLMSRGGPLPDAEGKISRYGGVVIDITERKKAEEAVCGSERRLKAVFDASMDAILVVDGGGRILSVNPEFTMQFGYESDEVVGKSLKMLMPADEVATKVQLRKIYSDLGKAGVIGARRRIEGRRKGGDVIPLELAAAQTKVGGKRLFIAFMHDLTQIENEKRKVEAARAELLHVARLSDMGEMAAGLAHEVSQPLTAIFGFARAARSALQAGGDVASAIDVIETQAERAADILKSLRGFIEKRESRRAPENLTQTIHDALALSSLRVNGRRPRLEVRPPSDDCCVNVDRVQI